MTTFVNAFLSQAQERPNSPAVMDVHGADTYAQLNRRSALLARKILDACRALGTDVEALRREGKNGVRIALLLPRTRDYMTALLAVLRAGCAAVPLDAEYPKERIEAIREDAEFLLFVTAEALTEKTGNAPVLLIENALSGEGENIDETLNLSDPDIEGLLVYTSGSTGKPKGVVHRQSVFSHYYTLNRMANRPLPKESVHCCMAGFPFIAALFDLTVPIMTGARVYIADEKERQNTDLLHSVILKRQVTSMFLPPKMFMVMRELYGRLPLRNVELGGEKANPKYADDGNVFEAYASSETFCMLFQQLNGEDARQLGKPAAGSHIYLADDDGNLVTEPGIMGELCVVSPWVAMGYNKLPEETAAKFTDCPFEPGQRMYRTGDYFAFDENGNYIFHGRKDRMVKLRGYRVELGEVENAVRRAEGIEEAACVAIQVNGGDKLCCYYTGEKADAETLKRFAAGILPGYMVPDYLVWLDALPRNERNKVNYLALKAMEPPLEEETYLPPETETERKVCEAFALALGLSRAGAEANFFDLGGTSLTVAVLIAALSDTHTGLSFQDVVKHPTPRALASYLDEAAEKQTGMPEMNRDFYPLTKTQMGIYLEALTGGNNATYTVPFLVKADASVTAEALISAARAVISAHPAMKYRICAGENGIPYMVMAPEAEVDIPVVEGTEEGRLAFMEQFFPVAPMKNELLFHFAVYRTEERCYLAAKTHLIFLDGTSISLIISELNRALEGKPLLSEEYTIQQVGMLEEQRMRDGSHDAAKQYHKDLFNEMDDLPALTGDLEGPLTPGVSENLRYEPGTLTTERVKAFCEKNQITESSFFMGVMALMLGKYLNSKHVSFSTVYNGRAQAGMERTVGTLIKRIPVYGDLSKDAPVGDYLRGMSRQVFTNMSQDIYSFDEALKECPVNEDVEFIYQGSQFTDHAEDYEERPLATGDKWFIEHYHTGMVTGCLSIQFFSTAGLYNMTVEYRNERFSPEWARRFAENLFVIAEGLLTKETIGEIDMLTDADREKLNRFNDTAVQMGFVPVQEQIHRHALETPNKPAVTAAGKTLSFRELNLLSNQIACALRKRDVQPETLVGVLFDREVWAYAAEIGILKAGGAFVPFIPDYPDERIDFCMKDGSIPLLLTTAALRDKRAELANEAYQMVTLEELFGVESLQDIQPSEAFSEPPAVNIKKDNLAYCIYTSGTTGRPKGVMIEHKNIANYVHRNEKSLEIMRYAAPGRVCLALASFSFDVSVVEEFVPLCNGNTVVIATEEEIHTPELLAKLIQENGVTGITCTPTYLLSLLDIPETKEAIRQLTFFDIGAEAFPARLYDRLRELRKDSVILNVYGPTEATMGCAAEEMTGSETVTVGPPIANTQFYVADPFGNELPVGIRGELIICGDQVGRGYINLPDKTAASFFTHNGLRAYHSGDLAAWTEDGKIRIFGRVDNQVKLRGFRIELDEIEKVMAEYPGVSASAVTVKKGTGAEFLAGYYVAAEKVDAEALKQHLQEKLPEYMVPAVLMELKEMPRTVNEKIDRKALPDPDVQTLKAEYVPPVTEIEKKICAAMEEVLHLPENSVGLLDDFFNLGGDSLSSMIVVTVAEIDGLTGADVFQYRTPGRIAEELRRKTEGGQTSLDRLEEEARRAPHLLTAWQTVLLDWQLFRPDSTILSVYRFLVRFDSNVDAERLCDAVNQMLQNRPPLSMKFFFDEDNELKQQYDPALTPHVRVRNILPETEDALSDVLVRPFEKLLNASLCRVQVFRGRKGSYLYLDVHHLLADGASLDVILQDILDAYFGRKLKKDYYLAFLAQEDERMISEKLKEDRKYNLERYGGTEWWAVPYTENEEAEETSGEITRRLRFTEEDVCGAENRLGVTLSVLQIASVLLALSRVTGKKDVLVSWMFSNRMSPEMEGSVGMYVKSLAVACRMDEIHSMRDLLASVREQVVSGISHSAYNYIAEQYYHPGKPSVVSNLQINMGGESIGQLHPEPIELDNIYVDSVGCLIQSVLLGNEYHDGGFDLCLSYWGIPCAREQLERYHSENARILEALVLGEDVGLNG